MKTRILIPAGGIETDEQEENFARYYSRFLREKSGKENPTICLLAQSQGEKTETIERNKAVFEQQGCTFSALTTFQTTELFTETFERADGFFVVGGNTLNMLAIWQARNIVPLLRQAYEAGKPIAGYSAGALCWFADAIANDPSIAAGYQKIRGLGWLRGSFVPHYINTQPGSDWRPAVYEPLVANREISDGYGCDDGVFAIYENEVLQGFYSIVPEGRAYKISSDNGKAVREIIVPDLLSL